MLSTCTFLHELINLWYDRVLGLAMAHPVQLICFFCTLCFFHISEFLLALFIHGSSKVSSSSFLLSKQYLVAMVSGMVEYGVEGYFSPLLKSQVQISYIGLGFIILGEAVRKSAILTAKHNFTHDIKKYRQDNHELVTHGVYRLVRHPSYMGFFVWAIGTQILLVNPICMVGYAVVLWNYFAQRIRYEEYFLRQFFGNQYNDYAKDVPSGIPFVK